MVSECGFDLYFPDEERRSASFHVPVGHLDVFFRKVSIHIFCPFHHWIICFSGVAFGGFFIDFWILALCLICHLQMSFPILSVAF